jgi:2-dehydro-3-deoxygalactonokinase
MSWRQGYIAVDWGTTNRRAYALNGAGAVEETVEDGLGIMKVGAGGFAEAVADLRRRLGDRPMLLAGMIGSNRGWHEAPYMPCPAGIDDLVQALVWVGEREAIVPGVSYIGEGRADVMRGEEVQLLGAIGMGHVPMDALVCHPGTHNKWVNVEGGCIGAFRTVMTGEIFNLLKGHSILADLLKPEAEPDEVFRCGARHGLDNDDTQSELFAVRARVLLGQARKEDAPSYTSGLLIGADVRIGLHDSTDPTIYVMGRAELTRLYVAAIEEVGRKAIELDGEQCFLAGIQAIAKRIGN